MFRVMAGQFSTIHQTGMCCTIACGSLTHVISRALTKGAEWWDSENTDSVDMYIFTHGHDYKGAIADYVSVSPAVAM